MSRITILLFLGTLLLTGLISWDNLKKVTPYTFEQVPYLPPMPTDKNNPVTKEGQTLGRLLFYDPILSRDSSISCATCHKQEYAFSGGPIRFNEGIDTEKMTRNTSPLFNLAWYEGYFWDGRTPSIESQVFHPVRAHNEMDLDWTEATKRIESHNSYPLLFDDAFPGEKIDSNLIGKAIAQFERTLISTDSKFDQVIRGEVYFTEDEYQGYQLLNNQTKGNCIHCHTTDGDGLGTTGKFANNGLDKASAPSDYLDQGRGGFTKNNNDAGVFKIPSLRNVALTPPYMHDGRFETLEEVVDFYSDEVQRSYNIDSKMAFVDQGGAQLTPLEKQQIIAFLHTLTDSTFISDPEFSNPYISINRP